MSKLTLNLRVSGDDPQKLAELLIIGISDFRPMLDALMRNGSLPVLVYSGDVDAQSA